MKTVKQIITRLKRKGWKTDRDDELFAGEVAEEYAAQFMQWHPISDLSHLKTAPEKVSIDVLLKYKNGFLKVAKYYQETVDHCGFWGVPTHKKGEIFILKEVVITHYLIIKPT